MDPFPSLSRRNTDDDTPDLVPNVQAWVLLISTEHFRHHTQREAARSQGLSYSEVRTRRLGIHTPSTMGDQ